MASPLIFPAVKCLPVRTYCISRQEPCVFKDVNPLPVAPGNLRHSCRARALIRTPFNERAPEGGAANGKADEPRNACRRRQPRPHPLIVRPAAQDDAAHPVAAVSPRGGNDVHSVFATVEPLDLPDIRREKSAILSRTACTPGITSSPSTTMACPLGARRAKCRTARFSVTSGIATPGSSSDWLRGPSTPHVS